MTIHIIVLNDIRTCGVLLTEVITCVDTVYNSLAIADKPHRRICAIRNVGLFNAPAEGVLFGSL